MIFESLGLPNERVFPLDRYLEGQAPRWVACLHAETVPGFVVFVDGHDERVWLGGRPKPDGWDEDPRKANSDYPMYDPCVNHSEFLIHMRGDEYNPLVALSLFQEWTRQYVRQQAPRQVKEHQRTHATLTPSGGAGRASVVHEVGERAQAGQGKNSSERVQQPQDWQESNQGQVGGVSDLHSNLGGAGDLSP